MNLKQQISNDTVASLKLGDEIVVSTLRMLKAAIKNAEISQKKEFEDLDVISVISSQIKSRRDSVTMYKSGGREELAQKEEREIEILQKYLPKQMSENDVREVIIKAITDTSASGVQDMGKVMGRVMPELKGKADGSLISQIVKEELSK